MAFRGGQLYVTIVILRGRGVIASAPSHPVCAQFFAEDIGHVGVVVLTGVDQHLGDAVVNGNLPGHRSRFHELRPSPDDGNDLQLRSSGILES